MGKMLDSVKELSLFVDAMPSLDDLVASVGSGQVIEYDCETGVCIGFYLYRRDGREDSFAVQRAVMSEGAVLKRHSHDEAEVLVLCHGQLSIQLEHDPDPIMLYAPDVLQLQPDQAHVVTALRLSHIVGITIPSSPGYPTDGRPG